MHLIDAAGIDPENPLEAFDTINTEMALYSPALARKPQVIALNKLDLTGTEERARAFKAALDKRRKVHLISAATEPRGGAAAGGHLPPFGPTLI